MKNNCKTPRFDVDYKTRLEQQRTANNAVRLPRLGYALYRVYDIEKPKEYAGMKPGPINTTMSVSKGRQSGKSQANWQQVLWAFIDELESRTEPGYEVKWLKPKHTTVLRMRGHRVEPAEPGDSPGRVNPLPLSLGR